MHTTTISLPVCEVDEHDTVVAAYPSLAAAAQATGINLRSIARVLQNRSKAGGKYWRRA